FSSDLVQRHTSLQWLIAILSARLFLSNRCAIRELKSRRDIPPADSRFMVSPENSRREVGLEGRVQPDTGECKKRHISLWSKPSQNSRRSPLAHFTRSTKT